MPALPFKHILSIVLSIFLIFILFITAWRIPPVGIALGLIFLLFGVTATSYTIISKNRKAYQERRISFSLCIKNTCLEILAIVLAMVIAGLIGHYLSVSITGNINSDPARLLTGIGIGILVGWAVGLLIKLASARFVKTLSGS
jgi:hypothetical protein